MIEDLVVIKFSQVFVKLVALYVLRLNALP